MKKILSLFLTLVLCLSLTTPSITYAATVKLNKSKLELHVGETYTLKLKEASGITKWTSSKASVAKVSSKGKITALSKGKTTITATNNKNKYKCTVTVVGGKTVEVVYIAFFDETNQDEYFKSFKEENPEYLDVKVYDDSHVAVTMYESDRIKFLEEFNNQFDEAMNKLYSDEMVDGMFTDIKHDDLYQSITVYADAEKYDGFLGALVIFLTMGIVSDTYQALNLVDVTDRVYHITVVDNATGEVIDSNEE